MSQDLTYRSKKSPFNVHILNLIKTRNDQRTTNTSQDVGTSTLEERTDTFVLNDLHTTVHGRFVVDTGTGSHHHSSSDGINRVRGQTGRDGDRVTEHESEQEGWIFTEQGLDGVVQTEVKTSIDEDTDGGDDETSVKTGNTIGGNGLSVDIDQTVKLSLTVLALSIVSHSGSGKVQRVDKQQRQSTSATTRSDVSHGLDEVRRIFGDSKDCFELFIESKLQGLSGEVSDDVGHITSPEGAKTFFR